MDKFPHINPISLQFDRAPANAWPLLRALVSGRPAQAPQAQLGVHIHAQWRGARAAPDKLARYQQLCKLTPTSTLPVLFVHAMAMPLHMAIFAHPRFPLRLPGLVHWTNSTESMRPIGENQAVDFECSLQGITPTERGQSFSLHTTASVGGQVVWRETSTYLSPLVRSKSGKKPPAQGEPEPTWSEPVAQWLVAANAGRRFAWPAGDWNPIHLSPLTARLFGYPRAIAHGMFSAARCLAMLQAGSSTEQPLRLELRFKRPLC